MAGYEEEEQVLSAIFKNSLQEAWKGSTDFTHYVAELMGFGLDALVHEPDRLAEERALVKQQTEDLAFNNYKTFIKTAECSREIFQDFQIIESHLSNVIDMLPKFSSACNSFAKVAQDIGHSRKTNMVTLQRHTQLLEVLEIPQLMDTCVRNGYYEEALELAAYTRRLEKKHSTIPIVKSICADVKSCTQLMLSQLLQQLRSDIQLPACLRIIGYLRRMDVFSEAELRIKFLQARDSWFQSILDAIPSADGFTHITKVIEASRVHLFDIVTQYRAIFSDDDPLVAVSGAKDDALCEAAIFPCWIMRKVNAFLNALQSDLERDGIEGRLDSIAGQCMYFGLSFSRVGCDFRGLLVPILGSAASKAFRRVVIDAAAGFDDAMQSYVLLTVSTTMPSLYQSYAGNNETDSALHPPTKLMEFTPLAVYCNGILNAFNNLRLCAPLTIAASVASALAESCKRVTDTLVRFHRSEQALFHGREGAKFSELCTCFALDLLPFFNNCLEALFPPQSLCSALGLLPSNYRSLRASLSIDVDFVVEPLRGFLPAVVVPAAAPSIVSEVPSQTLLPPSSVGAQASIVSEVHSQTVLPPSSVGVQALVAANAVPQAEVVSSADAHEAAVVSISVVPHLPSSELNVAAVALSPAATSDAPLTRAEGTAETSLPADSKESTSLAAASDGLSAADGDLHLSVTAARGTAARGTAEAVPVDVIPAVASLHVTAADSHVGAAADSHAVTDAYAGAKSSCESTAANSRHSTAAPDIEASATQSSHLDSELTTGGSEVAHASDSPSSDVTAPHTRGSGGQEVHDSSTNDWNQNW